MDGFLDDDDGVGVSVGEHRPPPPQQHIHIPVHAQTLTDFQRLDRIETTVATLQKQVASLHELLSRVVEINTLLKRQMVPTYDGETLDRLNAEAGVSAPAAGPKNVTLLKNASNQIVIKGKTFDIKDELKRRFGAVWNRAMSAWTCDISHELALTEYLRSESYVVN